MANFRGLKEMISFHSVKAHTFGMYIEGIESINYHECSNTAQKIGGRKKIHVLAGEGEILPHKGYRLTKKGGRK